MAREISAERGSCRWRLDWPPSIASQILPNRLLTLGQVRDSQAGLPGTRSQACIPPLRAFPVASGTPQLPLTKIPRQLFLPCISLLVFLFEKRIINTARTRAASAKSFIGEHYATPKAVLAKRQLAVMGTTWLEYTPVAKETWHDTSVPSKHNYCQFDS